MRYSARRRSLSNSADYPGRAWAHPRGNFRPSHDEYRRGTWPQQPGLRLQMIASILPAALTQRREQPRRTRPASFVLAVVIAALLLIGLGVGLVLDDRLGTRPIATLVCSLVAVHIAVLVVFRRVSAALRDITEAGRDRAESG